VVVKGAEDFIQPQLLLQLLFRVFRAIRDFGRPIFRATRVSIAPATVIITKARSVALSMMVVS